jgi:hypothetical protein
LPLIVERIGAAGGVNCDQRWRGQDEESELYIQYVGFDIAASSRIYTFHVIDMPHEARDFTVNVQYEAFRPDSLKLQDGPGICFARLARELGVETLESRVAADLSIGEPDIREYMERHYPRKPPAKKKEGSDVSPVTGPNHLWQRG